MTLETRKETREWRRRWTLVNERQARELRLLSVGDRARQITDLFRLAASMPDDPRRRREERVVRARWNRLRRRWAQGA
jgi:hypothetical protein